jgi:hypothetical protein
MNRGIFGVSAGRRRLDGLLIGPRPASLAPWFIPRRLGVALRRRTIRLEIVVCGVIVIAFLLFNASPSSRSRLDTRPRF